MIKEKLKYAYQEVVTTIHFISHKKRLRLYIFFIYII